jgi:hypothetical protein
MQDTDPEFQAVIQHMAAKAIARAQAGERKIELKLTPERHAQFSGQTGRALSDVLNEAGISCQVRQWTGVGRCGVLEVVLLDKE